MQLKFKGFTVFVSEKIVRIFQIFQTASQQCKKSVSLQRNHKTVSFHRIEGLGTYKTRSFPGGLG